MVAKNRSIKMSVHPHANAGFWSVFYAADDRSFESEGEIWVASGGPHESEFGHET